MRNSTSTIFMIAMIAVVCLVQADIVFLSGEDPVTMTTDETTSEGTIVTGETTSEGTIVTGETTSEGTIVTGETTSEGTSETLETTKAPEVTESTSSSVTEMLTSSSKFNDFQVLVVNSTLTENQIEQELNKHFSSLFKEFCDIATSDRSCEQYLATTKATCTHNVHIFYSTQQSELLVMYTTVYYVCDGSSKPMPSSLLSSFYNVTSGAYTGLVIVASYPITAQPSTSTSVMTSLVYVYDESYIAATIVLSVLLGIMLLAVIAVVVLYYLKYIRVRKLDGHYEIALDSKATYGNYYESQTQHQSNRTNDTRTGQHNPNFEEVVI